MSQLEVCELLKIAWPSPDGNKFYASSAYGDSLTFRTLPSTYRPVEARLLTDGFTEFEFSPDLTDEPINLVFADSDGEIFRLFATHGEGVKVELLYFYPATGTVVSRWFGQLRAPDSVTFGEFIARAESGFMSRLVLLPRRYPSSTCWAVFGGSLDSQAKIDLFFFCPYNRHIPGGTVGNLDGAVPYTSCGKTTADCDARLSGHTVIGRNARNSFTGINYGNIAYASSPKPGGTTLAKGNESNVKIPIRVILGAKHIRDFPLLTYAVERDPARADKAFVAGLFQISAGPIDLIYNFTMNDSNTSWSWRPGYKHEFPINAPPGNTYTYSGTAVVFGRTGYVPDSFDARSIRTIAAVHGFNQVRIYTDAVTYTQGLTNSRVFNLLEMYTNKDWGRGYDHARFELADWVTADTKCRKNVTFVRPDTGDTLNISPRTVGDFCLEGRPAQDTIRDVCRAGFLSIPYQKNGKYTIKYLGAADAGELSGATIFHDGTTTGDYSRNILWEFDGDIPIKPALSLSFLNDDTLPNKVVVTFEDHLAADVERPLTFESEAQQLKAGEAWGDTSIRVVEKRYPGSGVRREEEAIKLGWRLLHEGEFCEGGLENNLRVSFSTDHQNGKDIEKYEIIKVYSQKITDYNTAKATSFVYFRVLNIRQRKDGGYDISAQAYPESYYSSLETETGSSTAGSVMTPVVEAVELTDLTIGTITYTDGIFSIPLS